MNTLYPSTAYDFSYPKTDRLLLSVYSVLAIAYFIVVAFLLPRGELWLFALLIAGEVFHLWQALTYVHTVWRITPPPPAPQDFEPSVDILIPVLPEPLDIVRATVLAAKNQDYSNHKVYILNDAKAAKKEHWRSYELLAKELGVECITREKPGGYKAGNINHGLRLTSGELVVVFDSDHVPHRDFLKKTVGYFKDAQVGFVQTPQFYKNADTSYVAGTAWEQQSLFFGAICMGKQRLHGVTMCGTNMVLRRSYLMELGGIDEESITEDFVTGLLLHAKGYKSIYVPEVLAEGLAPEDLLSYYKQQFRWARGSLELLVTYNPLFIRGLPWSMRLQYLASASYFLSGIAVVLNALLPLVFLYTGLVPITVPTMLLAAVFLPYILLTVYVLSTTSNGSFTYRAVAFAMAGFPIHISALLATILRRRNAFAVTSKTKLSGNFWRLAMPHLAYIVLAVIGLGVALVREGLTASVASNTGWIVFMVTMFAPYIYVALKREIVDEPLEHRVATRSTVPNQ